MPPIVVRPFSRARTLLAGAAVCMTLLSGCATNGDPRDPLEPLNRGIYKFNDGADALLIRPAASFYSQIVPQWMRTGVGNFFSNLNDVIVVVNENPAGRICRNWFSTDRRINRRPEFKSGIRRPAR